MKHSIKIRWLYAMMISLFAFSCSEDEGDSKPVASFQFEADAGDFLTINFTNFSKNADTYSWDFGDGSAASTEENPSHTFAAGGTYSVTLTATGSQGTDDITKDVTVIDPDEALTLLAGSTSKTWKLYREGISMSLGPDASNPAGWWSGLSNNGSRNCLYEQTFTFTRDGDYIFDDQGEFWGEFGVFNDKPTYEICFDATTENMVNKDNVDVSAWLSGTHGYTYNAGTGKITLSGLGAWIGIPKLGTAGETTIPVSEVTFDVSIVEEDGYDLMTVNFNYGANGLWTIVYANYENPEDEPALSGPLAKPSFTYVVADKTVTFTNTSVDCDTYSWNFGDGTAASTAESPSHTYASNGVYTVVLTGTNSSGSVDKSVEVAVGAADLTLADLTGGSTRTWKLKPVAGAFRVGPSIGSGAWFASSVDDVINRACMFDDEFKFSQSGNYTFDSKGQLFGEPFMGVNFACVNDGDLTGVYVGLGSNNTHTFNHIPAAGADPVKIKVNGSGAFLGFAKGYNGGEYNGSDVALQTSVTYHVVSFVNAGGVLTLDVSVDISAGSTGGAWWSMTLVSE